MCSIPQEVVIISNKDVSTQKEEDNYCSETPGMKGIEPERVHENVTDQTREETGIIMHLRNVSDNGENVVEITRRFDGIKSRRCKQQM